MEVLKNINIDSVILIIYLKYKLYRFVTSSNQSSKCRKKSANFTGETVAGELTANEYDIICFVVICCSIFGTTTSCLAEKRHQDVVSFKEKNMHNFGEH